MKNKIFVKISGAIVGGAVLASFALPAFAALGTGAAGRNASSTAKVAARMSNATGRDDKAIQNRIDSLNKMLIRVQSMKKLSDADKTSIEDQVRTQISNLSTLKAKIDGDTDAATLKEDSKSITKAYRIYALVLPQSAIMATVDRINTITTNLTAISAKLDTRISAAKTAGKDTTAMEASLSDMKAKIADALLQASGASSATMNLKPDNGDDAIASSNHTALLAAREKIKAAKADLEAAEKDVKSIVGSLRNKDDNASATASTTTK